MSSLPGIGGMGLLQQKAAKIRAELQAREQRAANRAAIAAQPSAAARPDAPTPPTGDDYRGCGPVGSGEHVVAQGECMSSIAAEHGYLWETLWNDPANAELKHARRNPNALLPGDRVSLPAKSTRQGAGQTEMRHRFVRRGEPTWLVLKLVDSAGAPRMQLAYTLVIDGRERAGVTDGDGRLRERIAGKAQTAVLRIDGESSREEYRLKLGAIDPVREVSGIQARLNNLGYGCGAVDGKLGPRTLAALNRFRADVGLPSAPRVDEQTLAKLESRHDHMESAPRRPEQPMPELPMDDVPAEVSEAETHPSRDREAAVL